MMYTPSRLIPPVSAYWTQATTMPGNGILSLLKRSALLSLIGIFGLLMLATTARSEDNAVTTVVPIETIEAMHAVIRGQIHAFRADDAEAAYAYASPAVQRRFANPAQFVAMVRETYSTVVEHQSFTFIDEIITPAGPAQRVEFVSKDGLVWGGIYTFVEAEDGQLLISGVVLRRENALHV